jgi:hypothetical protein
VPQNRSGVGYLLPVALQPSVGFSFLYKFIPGFSIDCCLQFFIFIIRKS